MDVVGISGSCGRRKLDMFKFNQDGRALIKLTSVLFAGEIYTNIFYWLLLGFFFFVFSSFHYEYLSSVE